MHAFQLIDDNITRSQFIELLLSDQSIAHHDLDSLFKRFHIPFDDVTTNYSTRYAIMGKHNRKMVFEVVSSSEPGDDGLDFQFVQLKKYYNNKGQFHNDNKPAQIYYEHNTGRVRFLHFCKNHNTYKTIEYTYESLYDKNPLTETITYWSESIICKSVCIFRLSVVNNKVVNGQFNMKKTVDGVKPFIGYDELVEVCHQLKDLSKNEFLESFKTITVEQDLILQMKFI